MIKVGDKLYVIVHTYYHYIGEVVEILGVRRVAMKNVIQVHSHQGTWTDFFTNGITSKTKFDIIGNSPDISYMIAHFWPHKIPTEKPRD
jgi:hypothetical protein